MTVAFPLLFAATVLALMPPLAECRPEPPHDAKQFWFQAEETYVEPWLGPHNVYGVFIIPEQFKFDHLYSAKLTIHGLETDFIASSPEIGDPSTVITKPGPYTKRAYISTRTALRFLMTGRFCDLRRTCHWWLVLVDREWRPTSTAQ